LKNNKFNSTLNKTVTTKSYISAVKMIQGHLMAYITLYNIPYENI